MDDWHLAHILSTSVKVNKPISNEKTQQKTKDHIKCSRSRKANRIPFMAVTADNFRCPFLAGN
jgi:hypothetical protein